MKKVWMLADSIVSPLGLTTAENFEKVRQGISGINLIDNDTLSIRPFYGGFVDFERDALSKFEAICEHVIEQLLTKVSLNKDRTLFILSTTKGNISFLEEGQPGHPRIHLHSTAAYLAGLFGFKEHLVISNACISGVMALLVGRRLINSGRYDHALVVGADVLSRFVISGFQSLHALSSERCRPFDIDRSGINLGECAAGVVLGNNQGECISEPCIYIAGGGLSNDANHISGPSRTGEELALAIGQALEEAQTDAQEVDFISAHGTATVYNDDMEANALHIMKMCDIPVNSLKGFYGHTLGAAGVLETILSSESLRQNLLLPTAGFGQGGVSHPLNVIKDTAHLEMSTCLKTASGFGGCNAALVLHKAPKLRS
jgi:3-oxoacyl-[acyl-carrier-protein] synthase-1